MIEGRCDFGFCHIGHRIFVCGGYSNLKQNKNDCSNYDVVKDRWVKVSANIPDEYSSGIALKSLQMRFLYGFGGENNYEKGPDLGNERFLRLDT